MRMLILAITLMATLVGAYDFELCEKNEDCPTALRALTDTCALLVADNGREGKVCVDGIFCDHRTKLWEEGK